MKMWLDAIGHHLGRCRRSRWLLLYLNTLRKGFQLC